MAAIVLACASVCDGLGWRLPPRPAGERPFFGVGSVAGELGGVRVTATVGRWPPGAAPSASATPMELAVENGGGRPIRLRYAGLALESPGGGRYAALPVHRLGRTLARRESVAPAFAWAGFELAPQYRDYYDFGPRLAFWAGAFPGSGARGSYYALWSGRPPGPGLLRAALPEGVLLPGGTVRGHLYFQRVPEVVDQVTCRAELVDALSGRTLGEIRIPFAR